MRFIKTLLFTLMYMGILILLWKLICFEIAVLLALSHIVMSFPNIHYHLDEKK